MIELGKKKILLVNLFPPEIERKQAEDDATEMYNLITSLSDAEVIDMVHQRGYPAKGAYIGTGKAMEVSRKIKAMDIDIVILNGVAKSRQLYALWQILSKEKLEIRVWDRVDLILEIFAKHAHTAEAKLQIELASMRHMGPRIYGMGHVLSQQAGGIGTRGIGETNVELMKRHWKDAMRQKKEELLKLTQQRERQIAKRKESGLPTISIVGYTNAGKTTLFHRLTKKGYDGQNILFATLDSTVSKVYLPNLHKEVFVSDTIGFIKNLPPSLIDAFKSTLLESIHADILVHVLDGSSTSVFEQFHAVEVILSELNLNDKDEIVVINKADIAPGELIEQLQERLHTAHPVLLSAQKGKGVDLLLTTIEQRLEEQNNPSEKPSRKVKIISSEMDSLYNPRNRRPPKREKSFDDSPTGPKKNVEKLQREPNHDELKPGQTVIIIEKSNQKTGDITEGVIKRILSHGFSHPHGLKVELTDGKIGRVQKIV